MGHFHTYKATQALVFDVDDGFEEGMKSYFITSYDSKLITFGKDREEARFRMLRAMKILRLAV